MLGSGHPIDVTPSTQRFAKASVTVVAEPPPDTQAMGYLVGSDGDVPSELGLGRDALAAAGFHGKAGQALVVASDDGPVRLALGVGAADEISTTVLRDAAASLATAVPQHAVLAIRLQGDVGVSVRDAAQALVEGALLANYGFASLKTQVETSGVTALALVRDDAAEEADAGARRGLAVAEAGSLARDLANCPAGDLTATRMGEVAREVGQRCGLEVEVFDKADLERLGCGGLLGVNAGSVEPPTMVKLTYTPDAAAAAHLALVGKGVMYDSGGIALKPADASHSQMKNDMTGAGAILGAMSALRALGCPVKVTGYLMCTDNMPSGSATRLGDVLRLHGGTTVEVKNTDAEGRLVMADALVMAVEDGVDAVVDIATLTGQCLRTLGTEIAGLFGNDQSLVDQIIRAGEATDEPLWHLPLAHRYRNQLDSDVADLSNMGGPNAGSVTAALFLAEFVGTTPWAHIDIAGTAQADAVRTWRPKGATGSGTCLLIDFATSFTPPRG